MIKLMNSDKALYITETSVKSIEYNDSTKAIFINYFDNIPSTNIIFTTDVDYQQAKKELEVVICEQKSI